MKLLDDFRTFPEKDDIKKFYKYKTYKSYNSNNVYIEYDLNKSLDLIEVINHTLYIIPSSITYDSRSSEIIVVIYTVYDYIDYKDLKRFIVELFDGFDKFNDTPDTIRKIRTVLFDCQMNIINAFKMSIYYDMLV